MYDVDVGHARTGADEAVHRCNVDDAAPALGYNHTMWQRV